MYVEQTYYLQVLCNQLGVKDQYNQTLAQDGVMGDRSEYAIRRLPTLRANSNEKIAITHIQNVLGVSPTGKFGTETYNAVSRFQSSRGLSSDGIVGPDTWMAFAFSKTRPGYDPNIAASYAIHFADRMNPAFKAKFGEDCTNFVSEALVYGGLGMTSHPNNLSEVKDASRWYYYAQDYRYGCSTSFINASDFNSFWRGRVKAIDGRYKSDIIPHASVGDVIQYREGNSSTYWHSIFVTGVEGDDIRISQHSTDRKNHLWKGQVGSIGNHGGQETYFCLLKFSEL